jgi:F-type H+-transporting ATPase subunit delta
LVTERGLSAARRYARALLDVSEAKGATEGLDASLTGLAALFSGSTELQKALLNPAVPNEKKKAILHSILGAGGDLLERFAGILFDHEEFALLPAVAASFHDAFNARRGVVGAEATSAVALEEAQQKALEKALAPKAGGTIELKTLVDPDLLGGILVRMGGRTYDGTVRSRLKALRQALAGASE